MTIADIRKMEEDRKEPKQQKTIHLLKEGDWYRMHDQSAWLITQFPMGDPKEMALKIMAKRMKDGYVDAFCGFPCSSMSKYLPNDGRLEFLPVNDTQIDVMMNHIDLGEATAEQLRQQVDEWKEQLPMTESRKQRREGKEYHDQAPRLQRFSDIIARIVSIPLEDITPREAYDLLRDLRRDVAAMF